MAEAVQINIDQIKTALEHDARFFINFFLEDEVEFPVPDFHVESFNLMTHAGVDKLVCALPRGHAKTTLAKLACVWYFLFSEYRFIVYVSKTSSLTVNACVDIYEFMCSPNFIAVFGECRWDIKQVGSGFFKFQLGDKLCILKGQGAGMQVRGLNIDNKRPELAIIDDMEDNDNIATEELFRGLKRWVYGNFKKALARKHKLIWLGNMIAYQSILREITESKFWHSRRYGCILANGEPLWPDLWPIGALRQDFIEYQEAGMVDIWFAEMMNLPMAAGRGLIEAEDINYKPQVMPGDPEYCFMTIDLAISDKTWAHQTVIAVHGWVAEHNCWQIVEYEGFYGIDTVELFEVMLALAYKWRTYVVGIEDQAYQASVKYTWQHLCLQRGIQATTNGEPCESGFSFCPIPGLARKVQRLAPWAGLIKSGDYALTEGDFQMTEQLLAYDPQKKNNKDDYIDCASMGVYMMDKYSILVVSQNVIAVQNQTNQSLYDIASV